MASRTISCARSLTPGFVGLIMPVLFALPMPAGATGLSPAFIEHRGTEQLIAAPDLPEGFGIATTPGYKALDVALSADGSRIWFVLFDWRNSGGAPENEIWTMLTDGTGAQRVTATDDNWVESQLPTGNLWIETSAAGDVAVFSSSQKFSSMRLSDPTLTAHLFVDMDPYNRSQEGFRLSNDGTTLVFNDNWRGGVKKLDVAFAGPPVTTAEVIADNDALSLDGQQPDRLKGFDLAADTGRWWVFAGDYFGAPFDRWRYWLNHGDGVASPTISHETLPLGDAEWAPEIEVSDDGQVMVYCLSHDWVLNNPQRCWVQQPGSSTTAVVTDGEHGLGQPVLADGGQVFYVVSDWTSGTSYGFRARTDNPNQRRVAGSQRLAGSSAPEFSSSRMSDDGRILAAPTSLGIYVQKDGIGAPSGFPALDGISSGYDSNTDELVVWVSIDALSSNLERIFTLPLYRGIEPSRSLDQQDNPLNRDRNGGGVNWSTTFSDLGGGIWERRIPMEGKFGLLTSDFALRIVVVDETGTRTSYYDFRPSMLFGDGFESGDLSAWSATSP